MPVMARPSTLTHEITSQLCAARKVGATLKAAAGAVTLAPGRVARTSPAHVTRTRSIACTMEVAR